LIRWKLAPLAVGVSLLSVVLTSTGCGSSNANVRLVNAITGTSSVDMLLDNKNTISGISYGTASGYVKVGGGSHNLIVEVTGNTSPLINQTFSFSSGDTTVVATNSSAVVLTDDNSAPSSGNIRIRVINASPSLGSADVYVVASGTSISGLNPTFSRISIQFGISVARRRQLSGDLHSSWPTIRRVDHQYTIVLNWSDSHGGCTRQPGRRLYHFNIV
jgi:hypothetical protein